MFVSHRIPKLTQTHSATQMRHTRGHQRMITGEVEPVEGRIGLLIQGAIDPSTTKITHRGIHGETLEAKAIHINHHLTDPHMETEEKDGTRTIME